MNDIQPEPTSVCAKCEAYFHDFEILKDACPAAKGRQLSSCPIRDVGPDGWKECDVCHGTGKTRL